MPTDVRKALITLALHCMEQDKCSDCPMREQCGKMPCELDLDSLND